LGQQGQTAPGEVRGRRIEQRAVIGERDVVEIVVGIVGIEGAEAAIPALQTDDPFARRSIAASKTAPRSPRTRSIAMATTAVSVEIG